MSFSLITNSTYGCIYRSGSFRLSFTEIFVHVKNCKTPRYHKIKRNEDRQIKQNLSSCGVLKRENISGLDEIDFMNNQEKKEILKIYCSDDLIYLFGIDDYLYDVLLF